MIIVNSRFIQANVFISYDAKERRGKELSLNFKGKIS
jgi:hypothetical protein